MSAVSIFKTMILFTFVLGTKYIYVLIKALQIEKYNLIIHSKSDLTRKENKKKIVSTCY